MGTNKSLQVGSRSWEGRFVARATVFAVPKCAGDVMPIMSDFRSSRYFPPPEGGPDWLRDIRFPDRDSALLHLQSFPDTTRNELERISQLSLKELWLGKSPSKHTRWKHSIGSFNAAYIWLRFLENEERVPAHCRADPLHGWDALRGVTCSALLLHDYGHLPFSHLLNEVLDWLNWLPTDNDGGGLEAAVSSFRFNKENSLQLFWQALSNQVGLTLDVARDIVGSLVTGEYAIPWLQAIVNSPVDADKIDYTRFDTEFLRGTGFPVVGRINHEVHSLSWLKDFLDGQRVNACGLLCLNGRSARAAADLWAERMFLYDRFYLSPGLRVPERMTFEILQQYVIHCVMDRSFLGDEDRVKLATSLYDKFGNSKQPLDPVEAKFEVVRDLMMKIVSLKCGGDLREFEALGKMVDELLNSSCIEKRSKEFLGKCFSQLVELAPPNGGQKSTETEQKRTPPKEGWTALSRVVSDCMVREPILVSEGHLKRARDVLRPLREIYCCEALIDLVRLPPVLGASRRWRCGGGNPAPRGVDYSILVPSGPVSGWGPGKEAQVPLTDDCVRELELPYCRISIIAPGQASAGIGPIIWDHVHETLRRAGVEPVMAGGSKLSA